MLIHIILLKKKRKKIYMFELVKYNSQTTERRGWRIHSFIFYTFKARSRSCLKA